MNPSTALAQVLVDELTRKVHAAVAAISASNPLPALPSDYKGERIVLAFTFSYNLGR